MITLDRIQRACATRFGTSVEALMGRSREAGVSRARQLAMYLCRQELQWSYPEIGKRFGRDHTTAIAGVRRWEKLALSEWGQSTIQAVIADCQTTTTTPEYEEERREILAALRERLKDQEQTIAAQRREIKYLKETLAEARLCDPRAVRAKVLDEVQHAWIDANNMAAFTDWIRRKIAA